MAGELKIQAVVVLYKSTVETSATMQSLRGIFAAQPALAEQIAVLVYDNSPKAQPTEGAAAGPIEGMEAFGASLQFHHDPTNGGLATAYGYALDLAASRALEWLLLLDQDTTLTAEFFRELVAALDAGPAAHVCAVVPRQVREGIALSPRLVRRNRDLPVADGIASESLTVFNSASCVRVRALQAVGGFPGEFPLDYLDHVVFHRLQAAGGRLQVLPVSIEHQLSVKNLAAEMSLERYRRLLAAEWGYIREVKPKGGALVQRVRLLQRALSQARMTNREYARETLAAAFAAQRTEPRR